MKPKYALPSSPPTLSLDEFTPRSHTYFFKTHNFSFPFTSRSTDWSRHHKGAVASINLMITNKRHENS